MYTTVQTIEKLAWITKKIVLKMCVHYITKTGTHNELDRHMGKCRLCVYTERISLQARRLLVHSTHSQMQNGLIVSATCPCESVSSIVNKARIYCFSENLAAACTILPTDPNLDGSTLIVCRLLICTDCELSLSSTKTIRFPSLNLHPELHKLS
jgi:hypothetical protein